MLLLTYRSFFTPLDLFQALTARYAMTPPSEVAASEAKLELWTRKVQQPVQLMVCNVLTKWIMHYVYDDELATDGLIESFDAFVDGPLADSSRTRKLGELLKSNMTKRRKNTGPRSKVKMFSTPPEPPLYNEAFSAIDRPAAVPALEWARQLTLIEFELFERISPAELLGQAWTKKNKEERAKHVLKLIEHSNNVAAWVASVVLSEANIEQRSDAFGHLVEVASECAKLGNFNGLFEIMAGLDLAAVHRLKQTKQHLNAERQAQLEQLNRLVSVDANRKAYRGALNDFTGPSCIPYLGMYLTDLTFIEEGNSNTIDKVITTDDQEQTLKLINWGKHQKYAAIIEEVRFYQQTSYNLAPCESIENYLRKSMLDLLMDDKEQYERSLEVEPRNPRAPPVKEKPPLVKLMQGTH